MSDTVLIFTHDCPALGKSKGDLVEGLSETDVRQLRAGNAVMDATPEQAEEVQKRRAEAEAARRQAAIDKAEAMAKAEAGPEIEPDAVLSAPVIKPAKGAKKK